jgi:predicted phage terminase large subunit-like protein
MSAEVERSDLVPFVERELARRRLLDYARFLYPQFETPPHIAYIADLLEGVERGEIRRLMVNVPVRHGKSVLCSQVFPSWFLGRHPERDVIMTSHSEDLAVRNSRIAKGLVEDDRFPFEVRISKESSSVQRWNTTRGGGCYAIGVGGAITGRGANVLIVDDALHDGLSENERDAAWNWFTEVAVPRLEPGGAIVVIGARFNADDLCGRILDSEDGMNWTVVRLPALAEDDDPLGRKLNDALWPSRMGVTEIESRRVQMGSRAFESQFQQNPLPAGGVLFESAWFDANRYEKLPQRERPQATITPYHLAMYGTPFEPKPKAPTPRMTIQAIDSAWKTGPSSDYSVIATLFGHGHEIYVVDVWRNRVEYPKLRRAVVEQYVRYRPRMVFVEEAASGFAVVQDLRGATTIPIKGIRPAESKVARVETVLPLFESGKVKFPVNAPWMSALLAEFLRFPYGSHDDIVDAVTLGVRMMRAAMEHMRRRRALAPALRRARHP